MPDRFDPSDYGSGSDFGGGAGIGGNSSSSKSTGLGDLANWYAGGGGSSSGNGNSNSNSGGMTAADWLRWAQFAYGVQQDRKKPQFTQIPMTPEQKKLWDLYYSNLTSPAVIANRDYMRQFAADHLAVPTPTWKSPHTFSGDVGYAGSGSGAGGGNAGGTPTKFDWSGYGAAAAPPPPPSTSAGPPGGGVSNTGDHGVTAPVGSPGDPFSKLPETTGQNGQGFIPSNISDVASRWGKPIAEIITAIMTANPIAGIKGAWDAFQAWRAGGKEPPGLPQTNRFGGVNMAPGGGTGDITSGFGTGGAGSTVTYSPDPGAGRGWEDFFGGGSRLGGGGVAPPGGGGGYGGYDDSIPGKHRNLH